MKNKAFSDWIRKNRKWILGGALILLIVLIGFSQSESGGQTNQNHSDNADDKTAQNGTPSDQDDTDAKQEDPSQDNPSVQVDNNSKSNELYVAPAFFDGELDQSELLDPETGKYIELPYTIPGTDLVITGMKGYDGAFVEDGSNEAVSNVAALFVENQGEQDIEFANIQLTGENTTYEFTMTGLKAGSTLVALDKNKKDYTDQKYTNADVTTSSPENLEISSVIEVADQEDGSIAVTNAGDTDLPVVRLFYKYYYPDQNAYLGGISFTAKLEDLKAGETREIRPSHYEKNNARITMIRTYDESE